MSHEIPCLKHLHKKKNFILMFATDFYFYQVVGFGLDVNPFWKVDLDLDFQSHFCIGFGLDWQSKKSGWAKAWSSMNDSIKTLITFKTSNFINNS